MPQFLGFGLVFFGDDKYAYLVEAVVAMLAAITCHTVVYAYFWAIRPQFANRFQLFGLGILPMAILFVGEPSMRAYFIRLATTTPFAYCGALWTVVIAVWVLGTLTIFWLRRVFAATALTAGAM